MNIRKPAVAGQFYGAGRDECLAEIAECLTGSPIETELPDPIVAAMVPHAGWAFSGPLAAQAFQAIKQVNGEVDTFVIFGAAHRYMGRGAVLYHNGFWDSPLGRIEIDEALAAQIANLGAVCDPKAHSTEHSIEVQIPFIQHLFPNAKIVPLIVPMAGFDPAFGTQIGQLLHAMQDKKVVCIASTDLTHYGPGYGFCPEGTGPSALKWARDVNDRAFIDRALAMEAETLVEEAREKGNACGPGAVAAVIAAAKAMGRICGVLLGHTTSHDILLEKFNQPSEESVGYACIVF